MPDKTKPKKAHELLSDPSKWTRGTYARNASGQRCPPKSAEAVCFCAVGAIDRVYSAHSNAENRLDEAVRELGYDSIVYWNDTPKRTFAEVRDLLIKLDI